MPLRSLKFFCLLPAALVATATVYLPAMSQTPGDQICLCPEQFHPGNEDAHRQVIAGAIERWAAGGTEFFDEILADDVVWTIEGSSQSSGVYRGRSDFMERAVVPFAARLSQPVRPVDWQIWAAGNHVILNWEGQGVARDGMPYANTYVWILRMENGQAAEVTAFLDLTPYEDVIQRIPLSAPESQ